MNGISILKSDLNSILTMISLQVQADAQELIAYAAEDTLGGYHMDAAQATFPMGSLWGVEGQILYALVRWLKPEKVVEIGGWAGASASHLALAVDRNGGGKVISVDNNIENPRGAVGYGHGDLIPQTLRKWVELVNEEGRVWLNSQHPGSIGFIFEDADHSPGLVMELSRLALLKLKPGGILANHDAGHDQAYYPNGATTPSTLAQNVHEGLMRAGAPFKAYLAAPSDCGLAITVVGVSPTPSEAQPAVGLGFPEKDPYAKMFEQVVPQKPEEVAEKTVFPKPRDFLSGTPQQTPIAPIDSEQVLTPYTDEEEVETKEIKTPAPKKSLPKKTGAPKKTPTKKPAAPKRSTASQKTE